eukprot:TRINITY_DN4280_c0_g1_i1.p1 TRINITY_DN4280_c0_g1~~TRINITY_DN4280_c0_g1_i1.p1  ORF type:complete len:447 (-),score=117.86 TRINITY_DN4280_c0_g1_i1:76-1374(-)
MSNKREFDVVVWGASGFTGKLVAEYLLQYYHDKIKFAIAGRDQKKLQSVKDELAKELPRAKELSTLTASLDDDTSLVELAKKTTVLISTVGPYARYGTPVVRACVEAATNYVDITGEVQWSKKMAQLYHEKAAAKGIKIVSCCGFDSIPSDIGTFLVVDYLKKNYQLNCAHATAVFTALKGVASGGTIASMFEMIETTTWEEKKAMRDSYFYQESSTLSSRRDSLSAEEQRQFDEWRVANKYSDTIKPVWVPEVGRYTSPFVMALVNTKVVYRSESLLPELYGTHFQYQEFQGHRSFLLAIFTTFALAVFSFLVMIAPFRALLKKVLPKPGEGPTKEQRDSGFFTLNVVGESVKGPDGKQVQAIAVLKGKKDPGYGLTSRMVSESALCFVLNRDKLSPLSGFLTPASAFGHTLVDRLNSSPSELTLSVSTLT